GKCERARIHLMQVGDIVELLGPTPRLLEHLRREIDSRDGQMAAIARKRQPGADAHFEKENLSAIDELDRVPTARIRDLAKRKIVNRRPAAISIAHTGITQRSSSAQHTLQPFRRLATIGD